MINTLFMPYGRSLAPYVQEALGEDFKKADQILLFTILAFCIVVAFVTSWHNGYFTLGIIGGLLIGGVSLLAYKLFAGTLLCRVIMPTALTALLAISVQQANGLGEGHFIFFLNITIMIRYKDITPLLVLTVLTVIHHFGLTYCQYAGVSAFGDPLIIFSWGQGTEWGLLAPLAYHLVIAVMALVVATYYIYEGNKRFLESRSVIGAINQAADGDMTARISQDASSSLTMNINSFLERMHKTLNTMKSVTQTIASSSNKGSKAALDRQNQAKEQQDEISIVASAVTEMAGTTKEIAENVEQTAEASRNTVTTIGHGQTIADNFQHSISELADRVNKTSEIISELEKGSEGMSSIVATIRGISEQTNLLALNAAIEAARAGEQGRGFAVVADEVRMLSQRTHASTEEISAMISSFKSTLTTAVETMQGCHSLVEASVDDALATRNNFDEIASAIKQINAMSEQIATAAEQQSITTDDISSNTEKIRFVSEVFLDESANAAQQASELEQLAKEMEELLQKFQLQ
ncbi:methyl-accepting chemotaxis protein [Oceanospirillum beijerinckii]|uniref:methyl-accepting chemotaxis protein n=1 Tax=Oceanospirillum beijerinckii TaxID=64976 RepID=UPI000429AC1D|nr:methyl-accepting chemotaxis protein [Oceanospirillum beijerinckii]